jgi:spore maturation protein CgeB
MRIAFFTHSLSSDWNNPSAHFLRGIVTELVSRGHEVRAFEPAGAWSVRNLLAEQGTWPISAARRAYPLLAVRPYEFAELDFDRALDNVDAVIVHEWNERELVAKLGSMRLSGARFRLLFHDSHHRAVTSPESACVRDLAGYDGVLAFGSVLRDIYLERSWIQRAWVWHEAADVAVFRPPTARQEYDRARTLVFTGRWGDEQRAADLRRFILDPVSELGIPSSFYGARYPEAARSALAEAGARYEGWVPNFRIPSVLARHLVTVHVPPRPYATTLPGIPTIRVFEALACGIPLVSAPWDDCDGLFCSGSDYLPAWSGAAMKRQLALLVADSIFARELAAHGRRTVLARHTCAHRVDELTRILAELGVASRVPPRAEAEQPRIP